MMMSDPEQFPERCGFFRKIRTEATPFALPGGICERAANDDLYGQKNMIRCVFHHAVKYTVSVFLSNRRRKICRDEDSTVFFGELQKQFRKVCILLFSGGCFASSRTQNCGTHLFPENDKSEKR